MMTFDRLYKGNKLSVVSVLLLLLLQGCGSSSNTNKNNGDTEAYITRISVNAAGEGGNASNNDPSISADGRYIVFSSLSSNYVVGDTNDNADIFLRDTVDNTIKRLSVDTDGLQGNGDSVLPKISADGQFVVFQSAATNLVSGDSNGLQDIFLRDLVNNTTVRVSVGDGVGGVEALGGDSLRPSISADGGVVAFHSFATNLIGEGNDTNGFSDIFVRDIESGTTVRANVSSTGVVANGGSISAAISADGFVVAFQSAATNLIDGFTDDTNTRDDLFVRNLTDNTTTLISVKDGTSDVIGDSFSWHPDISADGNLVAFLSFANNFVTGESVGLTDMFVRDIANNRTIRVSVNSSGEESTSVSSYRPSISADGRFVVFMSGSDNLVSNDVGRYRDIFVHELQTSETTRVNVSSTGEEANDNNAFQQPVISADGKYVVFSSGATNLIDGDTEMQIDIFRVLISQTPVNQTPAEEPEPSVN